MEIILYFLPIKKPKRRSWSKEWYLKRSEFASENLLRDLKLNELWDYQKNVCVNNDTFNELLEMILPIITKQYTVIRKEISLSEHFPYKSHVKII